MHINDLEERRFLQDRMEGPDKEIQFTPEGKQAILAKVIEGEQWEKFLARKYVGTKRFGLDGGESMIPALEAVIKYGGQYGVNEIVFGMAHRGRLNVLANVMASRTARSSTNSPAARPIRRRRRVRRRQISSWHVHGP
jgi:2-oxoglutarate dehydrogenase E1 component